MDLNIYIDMLFFPVEARIGADICASLLMAMLFTIAKN